MKIVETNNQLEQPEHFFTSIKRDRELVLENALDAVIGMQENQRIAYWNKQAEVIFGWSASEALNQLLPELIIPEKYREALNRGMQHFLKTGHSTILNKRIEMEALHRRGHCFPVELSVIPFKANGEHIFYSFVCDITKRKEAEEFRILVKEKAEQLVQERTLELKRELDERKQGEENRLFKQKLDLQLEQAERSAGQFRTLANSIPQLAWMADSEGRIFWYNQRWYDYTGLTFQEMEHKGWQQVYHPDHVDKITEKFKRHIESGEPWEDTFPLLSKTGEWCWFLSRAIPIRDDKNVIARWFGTNTDVTEQRRSRETLEFLDEVSVILASSLDFKKTLESVAQLAVTRLADWCSIQLLNDRGTIENFVIAHKDPAKVRVAKELEKRFPVDMNAASGAPEIIRTMKPALHRNLHDELLDVSFPNKEKLEAIRELGLRSSIAVPLIAKGKAIGVLNLVTEGTGRHYGESDLRMAQELALRASLAIQNSKIYSELEDALKARDEFISIASHELKTPLTSLQLQTQIARRQLERGDEFYLDKMHAEKALASTEKQVRQLTHLVEDMLDVSRIALRRIEIQREELDLVPLVQEVVLRLMPQITSGGSTVKLHAAMPVIGHWDRFRMEQVVVNLVTNAAKYGAGKPIDINVKIESGKAILAVKDRGIGIAAKDRDRIFKRFERAVSTSNISGLGLGLYISREIVRLHGGTIRMASDVDMGSTFTVRLPLQGPI